jgi:hypothetical protein
MKITDRVNAIEGVDESFWNSNDLSITVFWNPAKTRIDTLKLRISSELDSKGLWGWAVEKLNFYSVVSKESGKE